MKKRIIILSFISAVLTGCGSQYKAVQAPKAVITAESYSTAPAAKLKTFEKEKRKVGLSTKKDPNYKSLKKY